MSNPKSSNIVEVKFVADEDVLKHISEDAGMDFLAIDTHFIFIKLT